MFLIWAIPLIIVVGAICAMLLKLLLKDAHAREDGRVLYDDQSGSE
jgi:hypothetical protein